jgi:hypothetical protein
MEQQTRTLFKLQLAIARPLLSAPQTAPNEHGSANHDPQ